MKKAKYLLTIEVTKEQVKSIKSNFNVVSTKLVRKTLDLNFGVEELDKMINLTYKFYNVDRSDIISLTRKRYVLDVVKVIVNILRHDVGLTLDRIGNLLNRHHSTIIHLDRKFIDESKSVLSLRKQYETIKSSLD